MVSLSGSDDRTLKLWRLSDGACLQTLIGHSGSVWCCSVLPGGLQALSGSADQTLKLWRLSDGACLQSLTGHTGTVNCCSVEVAGGGGPAEGGLLASVDCCGVEGAGEAAGPLLPPSSTAPEAAAALQRWQQQQGRRTGWTVAADLLDQLGFTLFVQACAQLNDNEDEEAAVPESSSLFLASALAVLLLGWSVTCLFWAFLCCNCQAKTKYRLETHDRAVAALMAHELEPSDVVNISGAQDLVIEKSPMKQVRERYTFLSLFVDVALQLAVSFYVELKGYPIPPLVKAVQYCSTLVDGAMKLIEHRRCCGDFM